MRNHPDVEEFKSRIVKTFFNVLKHVKYYTYWMIKQLSWDMERSTKIIIIRHNGTGIRKKQ